jgi:hypothetical protein
MIDVEHLLFSLILLLFVKKHEKRRGDKNYRDDENISRDDVGA